MNANETIFYPVFAQVFFTLFIGIWLGIARTRAINEARVHPQAVAQAEGWDRIFKNAENPSDAFENLFEVPVLFYAVTLAIFVSGMSDRIYLIMAWIFVLFRVIQGLVHCTYNGIMHRALAFWLGSIVLFAMWGRFAIQIIDRH